MNDYTIPEYSFDWSSGRIYGKDIDRDIVDYKFSLYDKAVEKGLIGVDPIATRLLLDDTIFAYAMLKWEGKPIKLRYYQDAIMTDDHRRIDVEAANQQGKSFSLCVKACCKFLKDHGKNTHIGLISKSMPQNSMNMRMVRKILKDSPVEYKPGSNDNMTVMVHDLGNGFTNTLVCSVASTSALGFPFDWLLLDEFEFWENPEGLEYMYDQVLEPRTFNTKGQIILYSNPNGKNFVSENLHKRKIKKKATLPINTVAHDFVEEEYQFHTYNINFLDNPSNTLEEWELKKSHTHPIIFASTMAAQRTESEGSALSEKDIQSTRDDELTDKNLHMVADKESFWFLDLGFVKDQSCLVAGWAEYPQKKDDNGVMVSDMSKPAIFRFVVKVYPQNTPIPDLWDKEYPESVPRTLERFGNNMQLFELDLTGKEGNEVLAQNAGVYCSGVKMSGPWKATHYDRFITLVKQGRIRISWSDNYIDGHNKNFVFQARSLQISTKMPDGRTRQYPLYHHSKETDHDDIIDAVVGCLSLMDIEMGGNIDVSFIETPDNKDYVPQTIDDQPELTTEDLDDIQEAQELNRDRGFGNFGGFC